MKNLQEIWQNQKQKRKKSQQKFLRQIKRKKAKQINELADDLHEKVFKEVDCLNCANCCTSIPPIVNRTDANRIAKHLRMKLTDFQDEYLVQDEDGDMVMKTTPCTFLQTDNKCMIYEVRPKACRQYPHTDDMEFMNNLKLHLPNSQYCPAVFHILERMMEKME